MSRNDATGEENLLPEKPYKKRPRYSAGQREKQSSSSHTEQPQQHSTAEDRTTPVLGAPPPPPTTPPPYATGRPLLREGAPEVDVMAGISALLLRLQYEVAEEIGQPVVESRPTAASSRPVSRSRSPIVPLHYQFPYEQRRYHPANNNRNGFLTIDELAVHTLVSAPRKSSTGPQEFESIVVPPMDHDTVTRRNDPYSGPSRGVVPKGLAAPDRIQCVFYYEVMRVPVFQRRSRDELPPHIKMGGVLMELDASTIAGLVVQLAQVNVSLVEMFHQHQGRCAIRLEPSSASSAATDDDIRNALELTCTYVIDKLHARLWMGPTFALYATTTAAAGALRNYVATVRESTRFDERCARFPRHLATVERWIPREQMPSSGRHLPK